LFVHPDVVRRVALDSLDIDEAKLEALTMVRAAVQEMAMAFGLVQTEWRPVMAVGLPESGEWVLIAYKTDNGQFIEKAQYIQAYDAEADEDTERWLDYNGEPFVSVTHWCPLIALPTEG